MANPMLSVGFGPLERLRSIACVREKAWPARTRTRTPARLYQRHVLAGLPNGRPQLQK